MLLINNIPCSLRSHCCRSSIGNSILPSQYATRDFMSVVVVDFVVWVLTITPDSNSVPNSISESIPWNGVREVKIWCTSEPNDHISSESVNVISVEAVPAGVNAPRISGAKYPSVPHLVLKRVSFVLFDIPKSAILAHIGSFEAMRIFYAESC